MTGLRDHHAGPAPAIGSERQGRDGLARWAWISIPLVVIGILIPAIQSRDGGAVGSIARHTVLSTDVVSLLCLGLIVAGIAVGFQGRERLAGRIGLWIGAGYFAVILLAVLLFGVLA